MHSLLHSQVDPSVLNTRDEALRNNCQDTKTNYLDKALETILGPLDDNGIHFCTYDRRAAGCHGPFMLSLQHIGTSNEPAKIERGNFHSFSLESLPVIDPLFPKDMERVLKELHLLSHIMPKGGGLGWRFIYGQDLDYDPEFWQR
jgi:hypothetical protein